MSDSNLGPALKQRAAKTVVIITTTVFLASQPAAAVHGNICPDKQIPPGLKGLVKFLHDTGTAVQLLGISTAFIGISTGATMIALPLGPEWARRGRELIKSSILAAVILGSARIIIGFVTANLPVCA